MYIIIVLYALQTTFQMMHDQIFIIVCPMQTTNMVNSMDSLSIELSLYISIMGLQHQVAIGAQRTVEDFVQDIPHKYFKRQYIAHEEYLAEQLHNDSHSHFPHNKALLLNPFSKQTSHCSNKLLLYTYRVVL